MSTLTDKMTDNSTDSTSTDVQVKEEPKDAGYECSSSASVFSDNGVTDSRNSSPLTASQFSPVQTSDSSPFLNQSSLTTNQSTQIPLNDLFAGSTIRSKLQGTSAGKKMDTVQNIVEGLLKKNETLLAMSDAVGFKPNARRTKPANDGFVAKTGPTFPSAGQVSIFPVSHSLLAHVNVNKKSSDKTRLIRPKSPTRKCEGMLKDKTQFTYALMESDLADPEIQKIFRVQNHELVCAISSKSLVTDKFNKVVANLEFDYFWCNFCQFSTNNKNLLTHHIQEHRFSCKFCAYESFCRSDIVRHMHKMHPDFRNVANRLSYCTLLSDYLRVQARDEKENKDPDEDVGTIDQQRVEEALQDIAGQKRKSESESGDSPSHSAKSRKIDEDCHADSEIPDTSKDASHFDQPKNLRENHKTKCHEPPSEADYDMFDMEVEEINDGQHNLDPGETDRFLYSYTNSSPNVSTTARDKQPVPTGMVQVLPFVKGSSIQNPATSVTSHPPTKASNMVRTRGSYKSRAIGSSSLYWSCGYCTFLSNSQAEIKDHSNKTHPGRPHRYVALIKNLTADSPGSKGSTARSPAVSTLTRSSSQSQHSQYAYALTNSPQTSNDSKVNDDNDSDEKEDVIPLKEKDDSPSLLKVKINSSKAAKKEIAVYKCYHCSYTARRHWSLKSHIYHKHRGMGLVAVDDESSSRQEVYFCARDDCTFRSENASTFLIHVDQCTPWNKPELADVEVEPHIRECLDQTVAIAKIKANENTVFNAEGLVSDDEADRVSSRSIGRRSSCESEAEFAWDQGTRSGTDDDGDDNTSTDLPECMRDAVNLVCEDVSFNSVNNCCCSQFETDTENCVKQNIDEEVCNVSVSENNVESVSKPENVELRVEKITESMKDCATCHTVLPDDSFIPVGVVDAFTEVISIDGHSEQDDVNESDLVENVGEKLALDDQVIQEYSDNSYCDPLTAEDSSNTGARHITSRDEGNAECTISSLGVDFGSDLAAESMEGLSCLISNTESKSSHEQSSVVEKSNESLSVVKKSIESESGVNKFINSACLENTSSSNDTIIDESNANKLGKDSTHKADSLDLTTSHHSDTDTPGRYCLKLKFKLCGQTTVCSISKTDEKVSRDGSRGTSPRDSREATSEGYSTSESSDNDENDNKVSGQSHFHEDAQSQASSNSSDSDQSCNKVQSLGSKVAQDQSSSDSHDSDDNSDEVNTQSHGSVVTHIESSSDSSDSDDNYNAKTSAESLCSEAIQIQNPSWLKDLIDSSGDSDSNISPSAHSVHIPATSAPQNLSDHISNEVVAGATASSDKVVAGATASSDKVVAGALASSDKVVPSTTASSDKVVARTTASSDEAQQELWVQNCTYDKDLCGNDDQQDHFLVELESTGSSKDKIAKQNYLYVPLRSAAVKALSKMKPDSSDKEINDDLSSKIKNKKTALKSRMSHRKLFLDRGDKTGAGARLRSLTSSKLQPKMSDVFMCQYCIDITEGPLKKIKKHVLRRHSSMHPVVINCFKQRRHANCQFYICPEDSCYKLCSTVEDFEAHKSTHETSEGTQKSKVQIGLRTGRPSKKSGSSIRKSSRAESVLSCRVELNQLDVSKLNSSSSVSKGLEEKKYQCLYCTNYYYEKTLQGMKGHYFQEHEGQLIVMRDTEARRCHLPSRIYVCDNPSCESFYINRSDLDIHARSHRSNLTFIYECASCGWYSASHSAANQHLKSEHADEESVSLVHTQVSVDEYGQTSKKVL